MTTQPLWKLMLLGLLATACREPTLEDIAGPESIPRPQLSHGPPHEYLMACRMWDNGVTQKWVASSTWQGACAVSVATASAIPTWQYQSNPQPLEITFSGDIFFAIFGWGTNNVWCPTTFGWTTYASNGSIVRQGTLSNLCNVNTDALVHEEPYRRMVIDAPQPLMPGSTVYPWKGDFYVPCPPVGDSVLASPGVKDTLLAVLASSRPNPPPDTTGRAEKGGVVYERTDSTGAGTGVFFAVPVPDPAATACGFTPRPGPTFPDAIWKFIFHAHPSVAGEPITGCSGMRQGEVGTVSRDYRRWGGGSRRDWDYVRSSGIRVYVIDLDKNVFKLDPSVPRGSEGNNVGRRWRFDPGGSGTCLVPF